MTSSHIHITSHHPEDIFLWRCVGVPHDHVACCLRGLTEGSTCTPDRTQLLCRKHCAHQEGGNWRAFDKTPSWFCCRRVVVPRHAAAGRPYVMAASPLYHTRGGTGRPYIRNKRRKTWNSRYPTERKRQITILPTFPREIRVRRPFGPRRHTFRGYHSGN
jgi:hypothetical protein